MAESPPNTKRLRRDDSSTEADNREDKAASENEEDTLVADGQQPEPLSPSKSGRDNPSEEKSQSTGDKQIPVPPPPGPIQFTSVKPDSVSLLWGPPNGLASFQAFRVTCRGQLLKGMENLTGLNTEIPDLLPGEKYEFTVATVGEDGQQSEHVSASTYTEIPAPEELKVDENSALVTWKKPKGLDQATYVVSLCKEECCLYTAETKETEYQLSNLDPDRMHTVRVCVALENGSQGKVATQYIHAGPDNVRAVSVTATTAKLEWRWERRDQLPHNFLISYHSEVTKPKTITANSRSTVIKNLRPGTDYSVSVCAKLQDGGKSLSSKITLQTIVPKPVNLKTVEVTPTSASLKWSSPSEMSQIPPSLVSYSIEGTEKEVSANECKTDILDLEPDTDYSFSIRTKFNGRLSDSVTTTIHTKIPSVKFFTIVIGNTRNHQEPLKRTLINKGFGEVKNMESCDVILAFCVIVSRVGTDMEAALKQIPDSKPAVLVVMHHTFDPDYVTPNTSRFVRDKETVDILFHEDKGILSCPRNRQAAIKMVEICVCAKVNSPGFSPQEKNNPSPTPKPPPVATYTNTDTPENSTRDSMLYQHEPRVESKESTKKSISSITASSTEVKYSAIVSGNTLGADKDVMKRLADKGVLPKEASSVAQCNFLMVFCPIVSSVGSDIEKAMKQIPDGKPSILVVMHHTFNTDYLPPDTRRYATDRDILIVDCLFYEDTGLLKCQRNDEALDHVSKWLHGKFPTVGSKSQNVSWASSIGGFLSRR